jgi:hypothetical protein
MGVSLPTRRVGTKWISIPAAPLLSHGGAASLFDDKDIVRIGHEETRRLLLRDNDPARPAPEETFQDKRSLEIGGERIDLAWHGANHSPDNIYIHLPAHDALMLVDIVNPGWAPIYIANLSEDIPGYIEAPAKAMAYPWTHFLGGHMGRVGTRDDVTLHQDYMADIAAAARKAIDTLDPTPYFMKYGENSWAGVRGYLDAVTAATAAPVIENYTGKLAAVDDKTILHVQQGEGVPVTHGDKPLRADSAGLMGKRLAALITLRDHARRRRSHEREGARRSEEGIRRLRGYDPYRDRSDLCRRDPGRHAREPAARRDPARPSRDGRGPR